MFQGGLVTRSCFRALGYSQEVMFWGSIVTGSCFRAAWSQGRVSGRLGHKVVFQGGLDTRSCFRAV